MHGRNIPEKFGICKRLTITCQAGDQHRSTLQTEFKLYFLWTRSVEHTVGYVLILLYKYVVSNCRRQQLGCLISSSQWPVRLPSFSDKASRAQYLTELDRALNKQTIFTYHSLSMALLGPLHFKSKWIYYTLEIWLQGEKMIIWWRKHSALSFFRKMFNFM